MDLHNPTPAILFVALILLTVCIALIALFQRAKRAVSSAVELARLKALELERSLADQKVLTERLIDLENFTALAELTSGIAHELNQPLNVTKMICQGTLHDIQKNRFSLEDVKRDIPEIVSQMNRLADIVAHMRVLTRPRGKMSLQKMDITEPVNNALQFITHQYKSHKIDVQLALATGLPYIKAEPVRFEQTVLNLLNQSRRRIESSDSALRKITLRTYTAVDVREVVLEVADNIPVLSSELPAGAGADLFLAGCQRTVAAMEGRLQLEVRPAEGKVFKVIFAAVAQPPAAEAGKKELSP